MMINKLKNALANDKLLFATGLIIAGYNEKVVNNAYDSSNELLQLAINMYNDLCETFNINEFNQIIKECWKHSFLFAKI